MNFGHLFVGRLHLNQSKEDTLEQYGVRNVRVTTLISRDEVGDACLAIGWSVKLTMVTD